MGKRSDDTLKNDCLVDSIFKSIVRKFPVVQIEVMQFITGGLTPGFPCSTHVKGFDIESAVAEGVFSKIAEKIIVNKHPIKGGVEGYEDRPVAVGNYLKDPIFEKGHGLEGRDALAAQDGRIETMNGGGLGIEKIAVGLKFDIEGLAWVGDGTGSNGEERKPIRNGTSCFNIHGDISGKFFVDGFCHSGLSISCIESFNRLRAGSL